MTHLEVVSLSGGLKNAREICQSGKVEYRRDAVVAA